MRLEGLGHIEISNYLTGNRTRDLPTCSIVPQQITLPRTVPKRIEGKVISRLNEVGNTSRKLTKQWKCGSMILGLGS
jgi:hypothetical protein